MRVEDNFPYFDMFLPLQMQRASTSNGVSEIGADSNGVIFLIWGFLLHLSMVPLK